ncbi:aspartyl-phosphate phosphatase Spo0E family protein [Evansella tamaricis]|uniref:Aspartyl-phosphate phosphatase Spo0E family protein n=1 Tax=Evansella tamaricis TaxID=2069301 RepID=A0ABS6JAN0_9BACI|nr:aspartyl-phosphate phosphatase Spo0E family protein [Evansella tamaricis]MBU9710731.1 aspartyl-phosphate phosphatase Spo0E family protein [Evansella tamaricis]
MNKKILQQELLDEIESAREKMHQMSISNQRISKEVVQISTYLDKLLNKYQLTYYKNN